MYWSRFLLNDRFYNTRMVACCVGSVLLAAPVAAQPPSSPAPPLSVEEAVRISVQRNPRFAAVAGDIRAAEQGVRSAGALTNPQAFFAPSITGGVSGGSDTEFLVSQPLELNGTRMARTRGAQARLHGTEAAAAVEGQSVAFAVRAAYYELVRAREQAALAHDLLKTAEELDRLTRRQVELGSRPVIEQVQTGIEVTRMRQQVALAEASGVSHEAALNALLNRPHDTPVGPVSLPNLTGRALPTPDDAVRGALVHRAEVRVSGSALTVAQQESKLARAEGFPDLAPQFRATSITRGVQQSGFGVAISLPLLDYGSRRGRIRSTEEATRAEEQRGAAVHLQIEQEAAQAAAEAKGAQEVLQSFAPIEQGGQNLLADAEQVLHASRIGYEEGKTTIVSLLEPQRTYRQVQGEYINARIAFALAQAELSRAMGEMQ